MTTPMNGVVLALAAALLAAPRIPYGGEIVVLSWGGAATVDPAEAGGVAGRCVAGAVFEPLYELGAGGA